MDRVEKAKELLKKALKLLRTEAFMECTAAEECEYFVNQALALLNEPCKTCGGSRIVPDTETYAPDKPCPDCQPLPASELRERAEQCKATEDYMAGVDPNEILDLYDRLAKRGKLLTELFVAAQAGRVAKSYLTKKYRTILGDDFRECTK